MNDITEGGKYYTPSIEEFHVGFKYEYLSALSGKWEPKVLSAFEYGEILDEERNDYPNILSRSRVRCLCHEDIVEAGWELIGQDEYFLNGWTLDKVAPGPSLYQLDNMATGGHYLLPLTILNISELKRIIKQVGI